MKKIQTKTFKVPTTKKIENLFSKIAEFQTEYKDYLLPPKMSFGQTNVEFKIITKNTTN